ncbi:Z1 domain-containing protein [Bacillus subtilis]|nr:Z1 domain-containing protein [Bacillus subtilis]
MNLATGNPTVFVVKKNSTVLKSLAKYIRSTAVDGVHNVPLAVIDDESDWASVNTSGKDRERTAVNKAIIDLLSISRRSSYLGITATPFANILIADDKEARDLFPRDYIMALESPTSYRGVDFYFPPEGDKSENVSSDIEDFHELLPQKHKKDVQVTGLAQSLKDAILAFFIATAERYRRDGSQPPSSMMVNVSRFNAVQEKFSILIERHVESVREAILASAGYFGKRNLDSPRVIRDLQRVAESQFPSLKLDVHDLGSELQMVAEDIHTDLVNGLTMKSRNDRLATLTRKGLADWKRRPAIFVGGNVLARGLTLDGLVVSYFTRRAGAADTLLQMGRWFGHRPGYDDLTRVWMDREVIDHFTYVAEVSQDLRSSVAEMRDLNLTPREFGLKIRLHPESSFLITAANKQRAGVKHDSPGVFSYRGKAFETHTIPNSEQLTEMNRQAVLSLLKQLPAGEGERTAGGRNVYWRRIPHDVVETFLHEFNLNRKLPTSKVFGIGETLPGGIATVGRQRGWTIGLMSGRGKHPVVYLAEAGLPSDVDVRASYRNNVEMTDDGQDIKLSQRRLATAGNIVASVTREERSAALAARKNSADHVGSEDPERELTQSEVLRHGLKSPMLLIYTVSIDPEEMSGDASLPPEKRKARKRLSELKEAPALVMATPGMSEQETREDLESEGTKFGVKYIVNSVYARLELGLGDWDDDDEDEGSDL